MVTTVTSDPRGGLPPDNERSADYPSGKSLALLIASLTSCPAPFAKIFCFASDANQFTESRRPFPQEGRCATSSTRDRMQWT